MPTALGAGIFGLKITSAYAARGHKALLITILQA